MKDQSLFNSADKKGESYLDDLAFAVCVNGESLEKYKKIVEKKFGTDVYANMVQFANTLHQQVARRQFTNTSLLSLKFIGKNAGLSEMAIDMIVDHLRGEFREEKLKEEERKHEDTAFWKLCSPNNKYQLQEYLKKFPTGLFADRAVSLIADLERIEKKAIEESRVFNQCTTQRDYMNYLSKYPNGAYAIKAKAIIEDFGRKEIEENRVYNLCKEKKDYLDYLKKYPNGQYEKEAQAKIAQFIKAETSDREETEFWSHCRPDDRHCLQVYLNKYPNGKYAVQARSFIANLDRKEKEAIEENQLYNRCQTKADYMNYMRKYPNGRYVQAATNKMKLLQDEEKLNNEETEFWNRCRRDDRHCLQAYLNKYPNGKYAVQARSFIANLDRKEKEAIEESRMYNQCRTKIDYLDYLRKYPNGLHKSQAQAKIKEFDKVAAQERAAYVQEKNTYEQCKTKDDYLQYISLYPNGMYVNQARNKIDTIDKKTKEFFDSLGKNNVRSRNVVTKEDEVPEEIRSKLTKLNKTAGRSYILAALAFAFLPNVFRWNHWAHIELEEYGNAPTLWLFWLPIVVLFGRHVWCWGTFDNIFSSITKTREELNGWYKFTIIPCFVVFAWMGIDGLSMGYYMEDILKVFMGPIVCGIAWCYGLYCEYKMSRIAKNLLPDNN